MAPFEYYTLEKEELGDQSTFFRCLIASCNWVVRTPFERSPWGFLCPTIQPDRGAFLLQMLIVTFAMPLQAPGMRRRRLWLFFCFDFNLIKSFSVHCPPEGRTNILRVDIIATSNGAARRRVQQQLFYSADLCSCALLSTAAVHHAYYPFRECWPKQTCESQRLSSGTV